jgi:hypothetical protein
LPGFQIMFAILLRHSRALLWFRTTRLGIRLEVLLPLLYMILGYKTVVWQVDTNTAAIFTVTIHHTAHVISQKTLWLFTAA